MSTTSLSSAEVDETNIVVRYFVDRGGTFTDCVAQMSDGTQRKHKVLSDSRYLFAGTLTGSSFRFNEEYQTPAIANFFQGHRARFLKLASSIEAPPTITITSSDQSGVYWPSSIVGIKSHEPCFCIVELQSDEPSPVVGLRWIANLARHDNLPNCEVIVATTIATNALLEGTIAKTALITTKGFEDLLVIGDQTRLDLFAIDVEKTQPMADKSFGVVERIDASGGIVLPLDLTSARKALGDARAAGCKAVAIALMNSYRNPTHEIAIANLAIEFGFQQVSLSSNISPTQSLLARAETTVLDSCLTPVVQSWLTTLRSRFPGPIYVVTSSGTKTPSDEFLGRDSLYSGPAGGALALHSVYCGRPLIGFDMGGTSTDISRYEDNGEVSLRYETMFNGPTGGRYRIVAPMIDIETIAAGGGSICWFDGTELRVGPASAGSHPGPACYGRGGPFTITDANVILGRIPLAIFPLPLDRDAAKSALDSIIIRIRDFTGVHYKHEDLANDFLKIANLSMAHAIRNVTIEKGKKPESHSLVAFGGAAPQHVCALADTLGIDEVIIHPLASYFSAFGLAFADQRSFHQLATAQLLSEGLLHRICESANKHATQLTVVEITLDLTYDGQSNNLQITCDTSKLNYQEIVNQFAAKHESIFGFRLDRRLYLKVATLIVKTKSARPQQRSFPNPSSTDKHLAVIGKQSSWDADTSTWREISILSTVEFPPNSQTDIPAHSDSSHNFLEPYILQINGSSVWVAKGFVVNIDDSGTLYLKRPRGTQTLSVDASALTAYKTQNPTPLEVTLLQKHLTQIADEMGAMLRRTALSINIKDRLDYSCAVFTPDGDLIVNAPHIPVHLGAMGEAVRAMKRQHSIMLAGEVFITNDPFAGGSHIPDVTVISPVFDDRNELRFFVANRAHHAEIGGINPGSMPPFSRNLEEEGVLLSGIKIRSYSPELMMQDLRGLESILMEHRYPSRSPSDNIADLKAQIAANRAGASLLINLMKSTPAPQLSQTIVALFDSSTARIIGYLDKILDGTSREAPKHFKDDVLSDLNVEVAIYRSYPQSGSAQRRFIFDFSGTASKTNSNLNANQAITRACLLYCLRCALAEEIPLNDGLLRNVDIILPDNSILAPRRGASPAQSPAVVGGNVETSQRIVDVIFGALEIAAASQGTMNNITYSCYLKPGDPTTYCGTYETICGGSGASPLRAGASGVHTHMTNTRMTDPEVLESRLPVRLECFSIRKNSGGLGNKPGGDGVIRQLRFLAPMTITLLTTRRERGPFGLQGGHAGLPGKNRLLTSGVKTDVCSKDEAHSWTELKECDLFTASPGDLLEIATPGGGGWGTPDTPRMVST